MGFVVDHGNTTRNASITVCARFSNWQVSFLGLESI